MSYLELLKLSKSSIDRNWLHYYADASGSNLKPKVETYNFEEIDRLTQVKLASIRQVSRSQISDWHKFQVFIVEEDPVEFIAAFFASITAEVDIFLGNREWQRREWQQVLSMVRPDLVFGKDGVRSLIADLISTQQDLLPDEVNLGQSSIMIPTGGTSGKIKFAIHTWDTLTASVEGFSSFFGCGAIDSCCTLPLYHVSGLMQLLRSLLTGGNVIICPYRTVTQIELNPATYFISLVPTQLQWLLERSPQWLSQFKTVLVGGAPARRSLLERAREYNIPLALTYGMTETASGIVTLKPADFLAGDLSSGRVLPHARVSLSKDAASKANGLNDDRAGIIEISSSSLCLGYYPQPFTTSKLVTDDLGYFDREGRLYLLGRNSHKIITGGENVFPGEVEAAILATELVRDVCVVGVSDFKWGEAVTAVYIPLEMENNLSLMQKQVATLLAKYKQPKHWIAVDSIPRNSRGKINYPQLKAIARQAILAINNNQQ